MDEPWAWLEDISWRVSLVHRLGLDDGRYDARLRMYRCIVELREALEEVVQGKPGARERAAEVLAAWAAGKPAGPLRAHQAGPGAACRTRREERVSLWSR